MFFQKIKESFSELLISSTAYGVPKIVLSKRFSLKIFWVIFFLLGSIASIYFICDAVNSYLDYEVITRIQSKYLQPMPFPAVSFCPSKANSFNDKPISSIIDCCFKLNDECKKNPEKYFKAFTVISIGTCYHFNSGSNIYGESVAIINSSIGGRDDSIIFKFGNLSRGLYFWIHESDSPPRFNEYNDHISRIHISSNHFTQIVIQKTKERKLGLPYNNCYKNVSRFPHNKTIIDYILSINTTYKQTYCFELCYDIDYIERNPCGCTNTSLGNVWKDCWLTNSAEENWGCTWKDRMSFFEQPLVDKCKQYCPLECDSVTYSMVTNSLPNEDVNLTEVRIYYESLKYTFMSQIPKTRAFDLISDIGGIFGLFIGVSFVSLFEIGELVIEAMFHFLERKHSTHKF